MTGTLVPSIVRTVTPIVVGATLTLLIAIGVELPEDMETELLAAIGLLITAIVQTVYYVVARLLERKFPQLGVLLGLPKTPDAYSSDAEPAAIEMPSRTEPSTEYLAAYNQLHAQHEGVPFDQDSTPPSPDYKPRHSDDGAAKEHTN